MKSADDCGRMKIGGANSMSQVTGCMSQVLDNRRLNGGSGKLSNSLVHLGDVPCQGLAPLSPSIAGQWIHGVGNFTKKITEVTSSPDRRKSHI